MGQNAGQKISISLRVARDICKQFEGFSSKPYLDTGGIPTIGFGTVYRLNGTKVTMQDTPVDIVTAELELIKSLETRYLPEVLKTSPILMNYPEALGAILSFCYNLGTSRYRASTLKRRIDAEDWEGARTEIKKWDKDNGKILNGLKRRRAVEASYFP